MTNSERSSVPDVASKTLSELVSLRNRCAVITGGAKGLGLAIATRMAEAGASIVIGDLDVPGAQAAARELATRFGIACEGAHLDVRDSASIAEFAAACQIRMGRLDIWVNNAGIYPTTPSRQMSDAQWDQTNDINLRGTFLCSREAANRMAESQAPFSRVILNIVSTSGFRGRPGLAHYTASKHGVVGLTKSMALELGEIGIRVVALAPTLTLTPGILARSSSESDPSVAKDVEDRIIAGIPLGRLSVPDDIARVALFAVSDLATFMTGTMICVDGGLTAF